MKKKNLKRKTFLVLAAAFLLQSTVAFAAPILGERKYPVEEEKPVEETVIEETKEDVSDWNIDTDIDWDVDPSKEPVEELKDDKKDDIEWLDFDDFDFDEEDNNEIIDDSGNSLEDYLTGDLDPDTSLDDWDFFDFQAGESPSTNTSQNTDIYSMLYGGTYDESQLIDDQGNFNGYDDGSTLDFNNYGPSVNMEESYRFNSDGTLKDTFQFTFKPKDENPKYFDTAIPYDAVEWKTLRGLISQLAIFTGGSFVEDKDSVLLYNSKEIKIIELEDGKIKKDEIRVDEKRNLEKENEALKVKVLEMLEFYNGDKLKTIVAKSRQQGSKFTAADYLEKMGTLNIMVNNKPITLSANPRVSDGVVLLPIKDISEAMGAKVNWSNDTRIVTVTKNIKIEDDKGEKTKDKEVTLKFKALSDEVLSKEVLQKENKSNKKYSVSEKNQILPQERMVSAINFLLKSLDGSSYWNAQDNILYIESQDYRMERTDAENAERALLDRGGVLKNGK